MIGVHRRNLRDLMLEWLSMEWPASYRQGLDIVEATLRAIAPVRASETVDGMSQSDSGATSAPATSAAAETFLAQIYTEYSSPIHTYAFRLLGNQEDADDVTQDVFIRAHHHLAELRDTARLKPWLYRIATNLCMDLLRKRARARRILGIPVALYPSGPEDDTQPHMEIAQPGGTDAIEGVAERDHIALALRQIPLKYAAPLVLHSVHGLSYREIAEALGLTPGAAAVRLTRARDLFAKAYEDIKGGETR
jgi:RNA polymerase sigma-70 factor, ECF subfamily